MRKLKICFSDFIKLDAFSLSVVPLIENDNEKSYTLCVNKNISVANLEKAINRAINSL